jgi:DNA polymerase III subunit gamma/tau
MGEALYRKYRSKSLSEIVGQEHITQTLDQALKSGRISHAYLFTGPRGVGKTSIARILAHEINGLPYTDDSMHMDIIEIDAASNRRIDEIRELREKVYMAPTSAKYKVYIIDEVHMLTREAFNALLKTLEEPPAHVVFILATTDAHKLPETIVSRTQRFTFKPVERDKVIGHLRDIAKQESITVSDEALSLLAEHGEGSFRDSISLLDQASNQTGKLEAADVERLLGIPPFAALSSLAQAITGGSELSAIAQQLTDLYDQGFQAVSIARQLSRQLRQQLLQGQSSLSAQQLIDLLAQLVEVPAAFDPERFLEIVLLSAVTPSVVAATSNQKPIPTAPKAPSHAAPAVKASPPVQTSEKPETTVAEPPAAIDPPQKAPKAQPPKEKPAAKNGSATFEAALWPQILSVLKQKHNTLYGVVRMAQPTFSDTTLVLAFKFAFHQKRVNDTKNRQLLAETLEQLTGQTITIECVLSQDMPDHPPAVATPLPAAPPADSAVLGAISTIFGGGELLDK